MIDLKSFKTFSLSALLVFSLLCGESFSQTDDNIKYAAFPPSNSESVTPTVMFVMSRDHQYFFKAYNDYTDLDPENDNGVETTYTNTIQYFGYFQSDVCYDYKKELFSPKAVQTTPYYCDNVDGDWSGNFLNWVSMTRMDIVRRVLYGGKRIVDSNGQTVLERAYLPPDAHSFVKYYNGDDIERLTPFSGFSNNNDGFDDLNEGISICNVTDFGDGKNSSSGNDSFSHINNNAPVLRVAEGNYRMWTSNERVMCNWGNRFSNKVPSVSQPSTIRIGGVDTGTVFFEGEKLTRGETVEVSSGIDSYLVSPNTNQALRDDGDRNIVVRIASCVTDADGQLIDSLNCKEYPGNGTTPSYKPTGLLQDFGESGFINFGLLTGSYRNNLNGGVLRSNVKTFSDEVNVASDGSFILNDESMVRAIDAFRIYGYSYSGRAYSVDCNNNRSDIADGTCRAWGNPISEIYRDTLTYLAGGARPSHSAVNDGSFISDLPDSPNWQAPLDASNQCSPLNTVVFNSSVNTYDSNNISIVNLSAGADVNGWTDSVGVGEGINGNRYYVGKTNNDTNEICTAKQIDGLSEVRGVCSEGPSKEGGYALAGLSYFANQTDLYDGGTPLEGVQNVETYGVSLASANPVITVPMSDPSKSDILIIPASVQYQGSAGALVDFQVINKHALMDGETDKYFGKFFVSYEVSVAGNDYDTDATGTIEYVLDESDDTITVTTVALTESAGSTAGLFGFVIDGTTQNGFHAYSGDAGGSGANYNSGSTGVPGCSNCRSLVGRSSTANNAQFGPRSHTFTLGDSSANQLEAPLFYASKWGRFTDLNGNNKPDLTAEWDQENNDTGGLLSGGDGLPDNYFFVTNPARLSDSLNNAFKKIIANTASSGTAPANLANADGSGGLIVQALYFDNQEGEVNENELVSWTGELQAFFIDEFGFFREDNPNAGTRFELDGPDIDKIFRYDFDETKADGALRIIRFDLQNNSQPFAINGNNIDPSSAQNVPATELNSLWAAHEIVSSYDNATIDQQRNYSDVAKSSGASRHILTWFDKNRNRRVDDGEQLDFTRANMSKVDNQGAQFSRYLTGIDNLDAAGAVVDFIRGEDGQAGTRNRSLTELNDSGQQIRTVKRLGDIINSTPTIVGPPNRAFNSRFGDPTYDEFLQKYANRREVMYIGGNDGLLHAINVGFRAPNAALGFSVADPSDSSKSKHALGSELWAYAPMNLLPHLRWLADPSYTHVFYVDGEPKVYDVNIFDDDEDHPNGWGTIMVVGMRLGGGEIAVNLDDDRSNDLKRENDLSKVANCGDWCARSAYVVLDITNPEEPPKVLAEINDNLRAKFNAATGQLNLPNNQINHTISAPTLIKERVAGPGVNFRQPAKNEWKLIFGNGVRSRTDFNTNQRARVFVYDLKTGELTTQDVNGGGIPTSRSFVGGLTSVDWNQDFVDDVVYFGTVGNSSTETDVDNFKGGLFRYVTSDDDTTAMYNPGRPVSTQPIARRLQSKQFVHIGTGRYLHENDNISTEQEFLLGLKEPQNGLNGEEGYDLRIQSGLVDSTDIDVFEGGAVSGSDVPTGVNTFEELQTRIATDDSINGWVRDLRSAPGPGLASERLAANPTSVRSQIFYTSFLPSTQLCEPTSGESALTVLDLITGTASSFGAFGFDSSDNDRALTSISLGEGRSSFAQVIVSSGLGANTGRVIVQNDTGELANDDRNDAQTEGAPIVKLGVPPEVLRVNWREIRSD